MDLQEIVDCGVVAVCICIQEKSHVEFVQSLWFFAEFILYRKHIAIADILHIFSPKIL
jgi:hypothetical protein